MQEVEIKTWCDFHAAQGEKVPGETVPVGVREIDFCEPCVEEYVTPLFDLLEEHGRRADPKRTSPSTSAEKVACYVDGCPAVVGQASLAGHLRRVHGRSITEWTGNQRPVHNREPMPCPKCGHVLHGGQGMAAHLKKHGLNYKDYQAGKYAVEHEPA